MVDRLNCLWHNTVIRSNYKDCDICRACSTHTHCSKCLMSRCIEECDLFSVDLNNRCTDVLCDTTSLTACHITVTDRIQKRCLTMVNMTHNTYNRRTFYHKAFVFFILFQKFFDHIYNFFFLTENIEFHCDLFCCLVINFLVYSYDLALHEKLLNNNRRNDLHLISKLFDCKNFRNHDLFDLLFLLLFLHLWLLHFHCRFLLLAFSSFSFESFISVFFFLIVSFFVFRFVSLCLLLFYDRCSVTSVVSAIVISSVRALSLSTSVSSVTVLSSITVVASLESVTSTSVRTLSASVSVLTWSSVFASVLAIGTSVSKWFLSRSVRTYRSSLTTWTACSFCS